MTSLIPEKALIERELPIEDLFEMSIKEGSSKKPIYQMHKWWARRHGSVFRLLLLSATMPSSSRIGSLWKRFFSKNELSDLTVLDPFMGGGTTIVEATKCGAKTIGVDIDPVANFITRNEIGECNISEMRNHLNEMESDIGERIKSFYRTESAGGELCDVIYYIWVYFFNCPECGDEVEAHPNYKLGFDRKTSDLYAFCSKCHEIQTLNSDIVEFTCHKCHAVTDINKGTVKRGIFNCQICDKHSLLRNIYKEQPRNWRLFAVEYQPKEGGDRKFKLADIYDLELYSAAEKEFQKKSKDLRFPRNLIPVEGRSDKRPISYGFNHYWELFNSRQLLCLSLILDRIVQIDNKGVRETFLLSFSDSLANNNMLCLYDAGLRKMTPLFGLHAYNIINRPVENNVWGAKYGRGSFVKCVNKVLRGKRYAENPYERKYINGKPKQVHTGEKAVTKISNSFTEWEGSESSALLLTQSSENLSGIPEDSIDLILTDPPYYDNLSYSELSDFYYVWIRESFEEIKSNKRISTPYQDALFVPLGKNDEAYKFARGLQRAIKECQRVLKPNGLLVFTYHHRRAAAWAIMYSCLSSTGFTVTNTFPVRSEGQNGFHSSNGSIKWDAVFTCRIGEKKKGALHIENLWKSVDSNLKKWELRLSNPMYGFDWADRVSLGMAFAIKKMIEFSLKESASALLLNDIRNRLEDRVPEKYKHLVRGDHKPDFITSLLIYPQVHYS